MGAHIIRQVLPQMVLDGLDEPPYCPWRSYWEPLVVEALTLRARRDHVDLDAQPAIVVEALEVLEGTQHRLEAADRKQAAEARETVRKLEDQRRNGR